MILRNNVTEDRSFLCGRESCGAAEGGIAVTTCVASGGDKCDYIVSFRSCNIRDNFAAAVSGPSRAGVILLSRSITQFYDCILANNSAVSNSAEGGVAWLLTESSALFHNCVLDANTATAISAFIHLPPQRFQSSTTRGGSIYVSSGILSLVGTIIYRSSADEGGGIYLLSGTAQLSNATRLYSNIARPGGGSSYKLETGRATYELPAPPGHWLPNSRCEAFRQDCDLVGSPPVPEPGCLARFSACKLLPDENSTTPVGCQPKSFEQPCDWEAEPSLLGRPIFKLPLQAEDQDFPFTCAAGALAL